MEGGPRLSAREYEELTSHLVKLIADRARTTTTRLERNVSIVGHSTTNEIDVVWEFETTGEHIRVLFECRMYKRRLTQKDLHAFRSVVDDVRDEHCSTYGVVVTTQGFQSGAQKIAETYGVVIVELHRPLQGDTEGRVTEVRVSMTPRTPYVRNVEFDASEILDETIGAEGLAPIEFLAIQSSAGEATPLLDCLTAGELNPIEEVPTVEHEVVRNFEPGTILTVRSRRFIIIRSIRALVSEIAGDPYNIRIGGLEQLAWVARDVLSGSRAWFTTDNKIFLTNS